MTEKWRPKNWRNPMANRRKMFWVSDYDIYEAGAEAMLKVLKKDGTLMTPEQMKLLVPDRKYPFGYLIFIPEES